MNEAEPTWNEQLRIWMESHPAESEAIRDKIPYGTLRDMLSGSTTALDRIKPTYVVTIRDVTGLSVFADAIDEPYKETVAKYDVSISQISKDAGVSSETTRNFLNGKNVKPLSREKIEAQLRVYESNLSRDDSQTVPAPVRNMPVVESSASTYEETVSGLARAVEGLQRDVQRLGAEYEPTPHERIGIIQASLDTIQDQLVEHYVNASQKEREELANSLDVNQWGYIVNVLGGIHKRENTPESFARSMELPRGKRRRK